MNGKTKGSSIAAKADNAVILMWDAKGDSYDDPLGEEMFAARGGFHGVIDYAMRLLDGEEPFLLTDRECNYYFLDVAKIEIVFFEGNMICGSIGFGGWTE